MSRNSKANNAARKRKKKAQQRQRQQEHAKLLPAEESALSILVAVWQMLDEDTNVCAGQIVLHTNGAFECQGGLCTDRTIFDHKHLAPTIRRCSEKAVETTRVGCERCWSVHDHETEPTCGGVRIVHLDRSVECTANSMLGDYGCAGAGQPHWVTVPCRALSQCALCGTDNEAMRAQILRDSGVKPLGSLMYLRR